MYLGSKIKPTWRDIECSEYFYNQIIKGYFSDPVLNAFSRIVGTAIKDMGNLRGKILISYNPYFDLELALEKSRLNEKNTEALRAMLETFMSNPSTNTTEDIFYERITAVYQQEYEAEEE